MPPLIPYTDGDLGFNVNCHDAVVLVALKLAQANATSHPQILCQLNLQLQEKQLG
ncbi:hypothetical protein U2718_018685 [Chlorogloeopsis sp. ULAP02]